MFNAHLSSLAKYEEAVREAFSINLRNKSNLPSTAFAAASVYVEIPGILNYHIPVPSTAPPIPYQALLSAVSATIDYAIDFCRIVLLLYADGAMVPPSQTPVTPVSEGLEFGSV